MIVPTASSLADPSAFIVKLNVRPDLTEAERLPRGADRKRWVYDRIVANAVETQKPFVEIAERLRRDGVISSYSALVSPNALVVQPKGFKATQAQAAFRLPGVTMFANDAMKADRIWPMAGTVAGEPDEPWGLDVAPGYREVTKTEAGPQWPVQFVQAPEAWAQGASGAGMVYGVIDTGSDASHEALRHAYRGMRDDGSFDNDYNWVDFQENVKEPTDNYWGHGTHVTGSVVGRNQYSTFGVAPDAKFIAARGLAGTVDAPLHSLEWMQAPTRVDHTAPDPTKAPDVVGMSWHMGRASQDLFRESIQNLRAAGIEVVKSAGNAGPSASSITSPGHHPEILATASVDRKGVVAKDSSRGPALPSAGMPTLPHKPDFAAPGVGVTSSVTGNRYAELSGTSMAQPHLSGAILDVLSKYPQLTHDQLVQALATGATDAGKPGPDFDYGNGIINIPRALQAAHDILAGTKQLAAATAA